MLYLAVAVLGKSLTPQLHPWVIDCLIRQVGRQVGHTPDLVGAS